MENFKDQVSFQCSFVYFSSDFVLFSPFQSEGAGQRSQWKHWDHENHPELGKLSGGRRKGRISNKREELAICQKFAYSLHLSAEQWAGFGGSAKPFTLPHWAHKMFGLDAAFPINSRHPQSPVGKGPGWDRGLGHLAPSFCHPATTAMSSRAQRACTKSILVTAGFTSVLQGMGFVHQDFFPYSTAVFPQRRRQSQRTRFLSFILWRL